MATRWTCCSSTRPARSRCANALAVSGAAQSLVLLGDPQQLEQPIQGTHPPGADASRCRTCWVASPTIPDDLGLFLERTWRLHPDICRFTSEMFYDGRLHPVDRLAQQIGGRGDGVLSGTGMRWIPLHMTSNVNSAPEEVEMVAELCDELIGRPG